ANTVDSYRRMKVLIGSMTLWCVLMSWSAVRDFSEGRVDSKEFRILGFDSPLAGNPNDLALVLNLVLALAAGLYLGARRPLPPRPPAPLPSDPPSPLSGRSCPRRSPPLPGGAFPPPSPPSRPFSSRGAPAAEPPPSFCGGGASWSSPCSSGRATAPACPRSST